MPGRKQASLTGPGRVGGIQAPEFLRHSWNRQARNFFDVTASTFLIFLTHLKINFHLKVDGFVVANHCGDSMSSKPERFDWKSHNCKKRLVCVGFSFLAIHGISAKAEPARVESLNP